MTRVGSERMTSLFCWGATAPMGGVMRDGILEGMEAIVEVGEDEGWFCITER